MTVWLVEELVDYEPGTILGIYATEAAANKRAVEAAEHIRPNYGVNVVVTQYEVKDEA